MIYIFIVLAMLTGVGVNVYWYKIKFILKENNYKTGLVFNHINDFENFKQLIARTEDEGLKKKYNGMLKLITILFVLTIIVVLSFIIYTMFE